MTRSKVLDEQRKRIGQACKGCQNRKQKCDGLAPCSGCEKRGHQCTYDPLRKRKSVTRIPKHEDFVSSPNGLSLQFPGQVKLEPGNSPALSSPLRSTFLHHAHFNSPPSMSEWSSQSDVPPDRYESAAAIRVPSQTSVCGSSTASFLAEIKKLVFPTSGPCPFTQSQERFTRLGSNACLQELPTTVPLPDRELAEHLVKLACQYSNNLVEILDESTIQELMQTCYSKLPTQEPGSLCLLYLLFAAGSVTLAEYPESASMLSDSLRQADEYFDFAEATLIRIGGYEKFEVWMIQAWALMTTYSLAASKWNAADAYIGLAVRAADVLGINHAQGSSPRVPTEGKANGAHTKLWKCLFVLDSLVAALLGRQPQALKEEKCKPIAPGDCSPASPTGRDECLEFNVASAKAIRKTIKLVYNQRHFPAEKAYSMLQQAQLHSPLSPVDNLATLHAILFRNYAMMLLTRPFFVQELYQSSKQKYHERSDTTWKYLSETCVVTAYQSVERIFEAHSQSHQFHNDYMWRQCLFTAGLIILSNQFFGFYENPDSEAAIPKAFQILEQCSARNPTEESEFNSLISLRRLVDERRRRSLPMGRPPPLLEMTSFAGYDMQGDTSRASSVFPMHDFAAAAAAGCTDSTYCSSDGRRYSVQSIPSSDYMEAGAAGTGIVPHMDSWNGTTTGISHPRCGSDAGCYAFAVPQDGYEGDAMQVTQDYTAFSGHQLYLPNV